LEFTADRVQGRRIVSVLVTVHPDANAADDSNVDAAPTSGSSAT